jgi:hypothetical protein
MQTIEEYKEYTKQLEGEVKQWHDAFDASQVQVKELAKENLRLERERVEQNSIIETCANELEELSLHEVEWDLAKARIKELEESQRWRKFPDEKPEEDTWCIVFHDGEIDSDHYIRFTFNKKCDFALYGYEVTHWMPLPAAPKEDK